MLRELQVKRPRSAREQECSSGPVHPREDEEDDGGVLSAGGGKRKEDSEHSWGDTTYFPPAGVCREGLSDG